MTYPAAARLLLATFALHAFSATTRAFPAPPNIILIVADDLGYSELGSYGQTKIRTPHLDRMAAEGLRFTRFYAGNAVCAPSRCVLMTGKHPGHAAIRDNREVKPEGQHPLPAPEVTLAEVLKRQGYATAAFGKWGLGMFGTEGDPLSQGFDHFFGYNCQRHAHSHYPTFLYRDRTRFPLPGNDGKQGDAYTQDLFEHEALQFLEAHRDHPFFLFMPLTVPHVALQVPDDALAEYRGQLGDDPPYDGKKGYLPHPSPHAAYAAMVTRMDRTVGRILDQIQALGLESNTLVLFTSDNGPTHNVGGADSTFFESAAPLRGLKGSLYEGGIRVPLIARWPGVVPAGGLHHTPLAFWDLLPTLADLAGAEAPVEIDGISFKPALLGRPDPPSHDQLYWEFPGYGGQQAVIQGDWKAVRQNLRKGPAQTELYNLARDPSETTDLSDHEPQILARLEALMAREHQPNPDFPLPGLDPPRPQP